MTIKFYRPDLKFGKITDFPCSEDECEDCIGIAEPFKCPCTCHMEDSEIEVMEESHAKAA